MSDRREITFAVDQSTIELTDDDRHLADSFRRRGVDVRPAVWGESEGQASVVLVRSTWDYTERADDFRCWLDRLDDAGAEVINPTSLLRWNMHKSYLLDLATRGLPVVATELLPMGSTRALDQVMEARGWSAVVIKPAIGATARRTIRADSTTLAESSDHLRDLVEVEDVLVQPFLPSIRNGELSVVVIGGEVTHTVEKRPSDGEWRVQSDFGGSATRIPVTTEHERAAAAVLALLDVPPTYARVDLVRIDGNLQLMELELVEPELFFRLAPEAAERLADVITARL